MIRFVSRVESKATFDAAEAAGVTSTSSLRHQNVFNSDAAGLLAPILITGLQELESSHVTYTGFILERQSHSLAC